MKRSVSGLWSTMQRGSRAAQHASRAAGVLLGLGLAVLVRLPLLNFESVDYFNPRIQTYPLIRQEGFSALASAASNYNPPYFYAAYVVARFMPDLPMVIAVKLPALITDFICALFVYLIVKLKYPRGAAPIWGAFAVLFAPTVVANAAFWGQVDSMHTAGLLACIYFLLRRQNFWAVLAFAVALAIKLQAIFLAPLLLALFLRGQISWKSFLVVPAVLFVAVAPAWIAGRPLLELLKIYWHQASQNEQITMNGASIYTWVPGTLQFFDTLYLPALVMGGAAAFLLVAVIYKAPRRITAPLLLELALTTVLLVPFFLPKMHERYFFPADVISIAFAMYYPLFWYVPLAVIGASVLSYLPFLSQAEPVPLPVLTLILLLVICILAYHSIQQLYAPPDNAPQPGARRPGKAGRADAPSPIGESA